MFSKQIFMFAVAASLTAAGGIAPARAQGGVAAGPHVSTLGPGADVSVRLADWLVLRGEGNFLTFSRGATHSGVPYSVDVDLASAGGALDVHPFGTSFTLSAGAFWNGNQADLRSAPTSNVTIGSMSFTPAQVGTLSGELRYNQIAPFVGVGYDSAHYTEGPFSFTFRLGLYYMGDARVSLTSTGGTLSASPTLQTQLANEAANLEDDFDIFGFFPVLTLGFRYRF